MTTDLQLANATDQDDVLLARIRKLESDLVQARKPKFEHPILGVAKALTGLGLVALIPSGPIIGGMLWAGCDSFAIVYFGSILWLASAGLAFTLIRVSK